jgi:hypothetical protein
MTHDPRTESVFFRLTAAELKQLEARATPDTSVHQVARDLVLAALQGTETSPALLTILAELVAMRAEVRNTFIGAGQTTPELAGAIKARADLDKRTLAQQLAQGAGA